MESLQCILSGPNIVPLNVLLDLGRKNLREILTDKTVDISSIELQELWQKLLGTACSSAVADKQLTGAYNAVCVFLRYSCQSVHDHVRRFGFSEQVWFEAFEIIRKAFGEGRNKPAMQVLEALLQILHENPSRQVSEMMLLKAVSELMEILFVGEPATRLKEACVVLSSFLRKAQDLLPIDRYSEAVGPLLEDAFQRRCKENNIPIEQLGHIPDRWLGSLLLTLLMTASIPESNTAATKLFSLLCSKAEKVDFSQNIGVASSVIEVFLHSNKEALKDFTVDVFPAVLNDRSQFHKFMNQFDPARDFSDSRLSLFLAILRVGRRKGFVDEADLPALISNSIMVQCDSARPKNTERVGFQYILKYDMPTIRLQAFDLLTASNGTSTLVLPNTLRCLVSSFKYLHDDTDSAYRDEFVSIARRFAKRVEQSYHTTQKQQFQSPGFRENQHDNYVAFLQSWNSFLSLELLPQASYQRHILALHVLHLTIPVSFSLGGELLIEASPTILVRGLLNLIFDAFDDVRQQATALLMKIASYKCDLVLSAMKRFSLVDRGQQMSANTNRADHADALGKLIMLDNYVVSKASSAASKIQRDDCRSAVSLSFLAESVEQHLNSIPTLNPASKYPFHGNVLGIAYIVYQNVSESAKLDASFVKVLLQICTKIWALVQSDLCIDSPETSSDEVEQNDLEGPKDLLAYSWRALRDSSLLMQSLLDTQPADLSLYKSIGELSLEQLTKLRHRGAFSTVAQTFHLCCQRSRSADSALCHELNKLWLEAAFQEIDDQSHKLTRRSAGLPSMFAALLDPTNSTQFLECIQRLDYIARLAPTQDDKMEGSEVRLPQVHALNCLKDVMMNSRFRAITEPLVVQMLNLAAQCIASDIWAVRNCGLMLFRASINRLTLDSSDVYSTQATRSDHFVLKTPLTVATNLLGIQKSESSNIEAADSSKAERSELVFAALDLLGHIPFRPETRQAIDELIIAQFTSKLWAVREHAARLKASRTSSGEDLLTIRTLLASKQRMSSNELHGRLLCCLYIYRNHQAKLNTIEIETRSAAISALINEILHSSCQTYLHPLVRAACLDLVNSIFISSLRIGADCTKISECSRCLTAKCTEPYQFRSFFLLHRAIELNYACNYIYQSTISEHVCSMNEQYRKFASGIANDRDIALYVIDILVEHLTEACATTVLSFLVQIALVSKVSAVQALAIMSISQFLPDTLSILADLELQELSSVLALSQAEDRDVWNSHLGLAASLLQIYMRRNLLSDHSLWDKFIDALRISQQDEVETPTRLRAVQAAAIVTSHVFGQDGVMDINVEIRQARLLMVLYDFLNDDDGEIRQISAKAVYDIIKRHHNLPHVSTGCAAAARDTFAKLMSSRYLTLDSFTASAYSKIIGIKASTELNEVRNLIYFCQNNSVEYIVHVLLGSANDLFAEERQNLYIDDIAEVDIWSAIVRQNGLRALPDDAIQTMFSWTLQGLSSLEALLRREFYGADPRSDTLDHQDAHFIHPLGLTHNSEVLIVYVRVVAVAGLLRLHCRGSEAQTKVLVDLQNSLELQLRSLQTTCHHCVGHERVLTAIEIALSN